MQQELQTEGPRALLRSYFKPGERVLWQGSPVQGFRLGSPGLGFFFLGGIFIAFGIFWMILLAPSSIPVALIGLLPVAVGLFVGPGQSWIDARTRRNTIYGLTDQRILIVRGFRSPKPRTFDTQTTKRIDLIQHHGGGGEILIGDLKVPDELQEMWRDGAWSGLVGSEENFVGSRDSRRGSGDSRPRILLEHDAKRVYELMRSQLPAETAGIVKQR